MAQKHNKWMTILQAVFSALASLFGTIKITKSDNSEISDSTEPPEL